MSPLAAILCGPLRLEIVTVEALDKVLDFLYARESCVKKAPHGVPEFQLDAFAKGPETSATLLCAEVITPRPVKPSAATSSCVSDGFSTPPKTHPSAQLGDQVGDQVGRADHDISSHRPRDDFRKSGVCFKPLVDYSFLLDSLDGNNCFNKNKKMIRRAIFAESKDQGDVSRPVGPDPHGLGALDRSLRCCDLGSVIGSPSRKECVGRARSQAIAEESEGSEEGDDVYDEDSDESLDWSNSEEDV